MKSAKQTMDDAAAELGKLMDERQGRRKAHQAALYAHLRTFIAMTMDKDCPILGLHAVGFDEALRTYVFSAGSTPALETMLAGVGHLQAHVLSNQLIRMTTKPTHGLGDQYNPESGVVQCIGCDDGDPTGAHAKKELEENARAWLGLVVEVGRSFYGEHLPQDAAELLDKLAAISAPADSHVS